ncbi:MAG: TetR/AcrR family transcriptional regulator [Vicinamibacterales bacterium]
MPRPREIDDEQILTIARKLLIEKGLSVSTRAIASAAGVSEGVLFQRFKSKNGLIRAALRLPAVAPEALLGNAAGHVDPARAFEDVLVALFGAFRQSAHATLPRLAAGPAGRSVLEDPAGWAAFRTALETHLAAEQRRGRLRPTSVADLAFLLTSALQHAALVEVVAGPSPAVSELAVRRMARAVWVGVDPGDEQSSQPG